MKVTTALSFAASAVAIQHDGNTAQIPLEPSTILEPAPLTLDSIPLLGFGTWNLKGDNVSEAVSWAIQTGYRHIDCAAIYGNEELVGKGIADGMAKTGLKREDIWVTSKLWNDHHGTTAPEAGIDTTLSNLGVGYLDLYHMHWPVAQKSGKNKIEYHDTWAAMGLLLEMGKTRHIGVSNFDPEQLKDLLNHTSHPPSVHQMELHPYLPQTEWIDFHEKHGIHVTAYSPFAGTNPTYAGSAKDLEPLMKNTVLKKIAEKRECTPAQVALAWGMGRGTSVIPKSQHKEYIEQNFGGLECFLEPEDVEKIHGLGEAHHRFNNPSKGWKVPLYKGLEGT